MLLIVPFLLSLSVKNEKIESLKQENLTLDNTQKRLLWILGGLVLLLLVNTPIKPYYTGLGLLMFMPKIGFL